MSNQKWMYRRGEDGEIEAKLFKDAADIPKDIWYESPAFLPEAEPSPEPPKPKALIKSTNKPRTTRRKLK